MGKDRYIEFCSSPEGESVSLYGQPWMLDYVCRYLGGYWDVLVEEKDGRICGTLPVYIKENHGLKYIQVPYRCQTNGMWMNQGLGEAASVVMTGLFCKLERYVRENKIVYAQESFPPEITDFASFYRKGWNICTRYTFRIKNMPYESAKANYSKQLRKNLRGSTKGLIVKESNDVELMYSMHKMTMERQNLRSSHRIETVQSLYDELHDRNQGKIFLALDSDKNCIGSFFCAFDRRWLYFFMSGADPSYRDQNPQSMLTDYAIKYACDNGLGVDFEGSMVPGIYAFNQTWGGCQTPYYTVYKIMSRNPIIRIGIENKLRKMGL